jgi:hypothetical protein
MRKSFMSYRGGEQVRFGFYWNLSEWEVQIVQAEGGVLKGGADSRYMRLPLPVLLVVAPLMGAIYAFFLPFIGIAMVAMFLGGRLKSLFVTTPPPIEATADGAAPAPKAGKHAA